MSETREKERKRVMNEEEAEVSDLDRRGKQKIEKAFLEYLK